METIYSIFSNAMGTVVPFIILLGVLVFVHELGHFLVAIWCGVRVEVFSLGFGKKIFKFKRGHTTYAISIIPLGGYVKMFGEQNGDVVAEADRSFSFTHKSVWKRIAIVLAGPLMNLFFAAFIFMVIALLGEVAVSPILGDIASSSKAYSYGFRSGDHIKKVDDQDILSWEDVQKFLNEKQGQSVRFTVNPEGNQELKTINAEITSQPSQNLLSLSDTVGTVEGLNLTSMGTTVGVMSDSPLKMLGLKTGNTITSINGVRVQTWRALLANLNQQDVQKPLEIQFVESAEKWQLSATASQALQTPQTLTYSSVEGKTFTPEILGLESSELYVQKVVEKSPAEKAGLQAGDRFVSINNQEIHQWENVLNTIKSSDGTKPLVMEVDRNGEKKTFSILPELTSQMTYQGSEEKRQTIGIMSTPNWAELQQISVKTSNPFVALQKGISRSLEFSLMTAMSIVRLVQTKISHKNVGGIISIGIVARNSFRAGITDFLQKMAMLSISLFILNLLPVPVLDGGHLLFYVIELIKGSPLSMSKLEVAQQIGLALLLALMVLSFYNDVSRVLGL